MSLYNLNKMQETVITKDIYRDHPQKYFIDQRPMLNYLESIEFKAFENIVFDNISGKELIHDLMLCFIGVKNKQYAPYLELKAWETIVEYNLLENVPSWVYAYAGYKYGHNKNKMYMAVMAERILTNISKITNLQSNRKLGYVYIFLYSFMKKEYITNKALRNHIYSYKTIIGTLDSTLGNMKSMIKCCLVNLNPDAFVQNCPILACVLFIDILYNFFKNNSLDQNYGIEFYHLRDWYLLSIKQILEQYV